MNFRTRLLFTINPIVCLSLLIFASLATAGQVTLVWDDINEPKLNGYKVYYKIWSSGVPYNGTGLSQGDSPIIVPLASLNDPKNPEFGLSGLVPGAHYYFAVSAYSDAGDESLLSNEVSMPAVGLSQNPAEENFPLICLTFK